MSRDRFALAPAPIGVTNGVSEWVYDTDVGYVGYVIYGADMRSWVACITAFMQHFSLEIHQFGPTSRDQDLGAHIPIDRPITEPARCEVRFTSYVHSLKRCRAGARSHA